MSASQSKRLFAVVVAVLLFVSYLATRDTVRVEAKLSRGDLKAIVNGTEEWSSPKLFRHIEVKPGPEGTVLSWLREPGERWSVTVFSNSMGSWKKVSWFLADADHSVIKK